MNESGEWPGSRWWRVDLHAHTPCSYDFDTREVPDWNRWIDSAVNAGIEAIAISDHNTAQAVEHLQRAAETADHPPVLFPGVELTAGDGTHLLILIDPKQTGRHIEDILSRLGLGVDNQGRQQSRSTASVEQILTDCGDEGIVIAAHINDNSGLLSITGEQRIAILRHPRLAAVEVDPTKYLDEQWIDGSLPQIGRDLPRIWSSDSHDFTKMGRRYTWIKMTTPNLEGLRLAFLDGADSLIPVYDSNQHNPNQHAERLIERIIVRDGKYMGRAQPLQINFSPWLNAIIGGRGTGKSTVVDFLRATLRRESELNTVSGDEDGMLRNSFEKRMSVPASRSAEGLLEDSTHIEVWYQTFRDRFVLSWSRDGKAHPIARIDGDKRIPEEGNIRERFPVRIYSQKQLFSLAQNPDSLLMVIDDNQDVRRGDLDREMESLRARYLSLEAEARSAYLRSQELPSRRASLDDTNRKLEVFQKGGHQRAFSEYRLQSQLDDTWNTILKDAAQAVESVSEIAESLTVPDIEAGSAIDDNNPAIGSLRSAHRELKQSVEDLGRLLQVEATKTRRAISKIETGDDANSWHGELITGELRFQQTSARLAEQGVSDPSAYINLLQEASELRQEIASLELEQLRAETLRQEANDELNNLRKLRQKLSDKRSQFAKKTSGEFIDVQIRRFARIENLTGDLSKILGIERFEDDRNLIAKRIASTVEQHWDWDGLDQVVADMRRFCSGEIDTWDGKDHRFANAMKNTPPERLDRLALYLPEDSVDVRIRDRHGDRLTSLQQGSPGQQSAALLSFVLAYGEEPIILDQPEDDLDNKLIYDLVVKQLRATKSNRQVIVVTHNANIVVHGSAELVLPLVAKSGQSYVDGAGGLQERQVRNEICRVMEGGEEAFAARYERIMPTRSDRYE